ncbi:MAG: homocitrate synthase family protein [Candidatus Hydrothermarchaeota archaeon]|nr:homocitrate synthase family protein [Candidatus Hydrothermarchaeota archaeon]
MFVSLYNFEDEVRKGFSFAAPKINDTTLRDGEQTPGVVFSLEEKIQIARLLDEIGVQQIEAGTPAMSPEETRAVGTIVKEELNASIMGWSRAVQSDIDAVLKTEADAIAISIATSDIHLRYKLNMTREQVLEKATSMVEYAKSHGLYVSLNSEDATRTDFVFLKEFALKGKEAGADRLRICDTLGVLIPASSNYLTRRIIEEVKIPVEIHTHDDYSLAVANALAAFEAGAEWASTTVNGLGERAGNSSLEGVIMGLIKLYNLHLPFKISKICEISHYVEKASGISVPPNRSIVGAHMFTHESGIHVDGVLKYPYTYESFLPDEIGTSRKIVIGKHSGKHAVWDKLKELGINVSKEQLIKIVDVVKRSSQERKSAITGEELREIANEVIGVKKAQ